jgi:hemerythrin-like domain-containing protein
VRINRASLATPAELKAWQSEIRQHFEQEIQFHFAAEEAHLFPAARDYPELGPVVDELLAEHRQLRHDFAQAGDGALDDSRLRQFAETLSSHIRKEERVLFEELQRRMGPEELSRIGARIEEALALAPQACIVPTEETLKARDV